MYVRSGCFFVCNFPLCKFDHPKISPNYAYAATRMLYVLALRGDAPKCFARLSNSGVPRCALVATTAVAGLCFLTSLFDNRDVYLWLLNTSGMCGFIAWLGIAVSHYRFRRGYVLKGCDLSKLPYRSGFSPGARSSPSFSA